MPVSAGAAQNSEASFLVTNVSQLWSVPREVFLGRCAFQLEGIVTLVDTHRDLLVLQDETGAVALNPKSGTRDLAIQAGQRVSLRASRCFPYVLSFPHYPYQPSGSGVMPSFESPRNSGDYYLTRMRGCLQPPVTGEYTFWIASDNSSELWLSSSEDPARVKKVAFIARYSWGSPREWSRYPSQRSESIFLQAGRSYYLEAFHEQTTGNSHLSVAWQGPSVSQSVIEGRFLTPWTEERDLASSMRTNGMRREYWTNFSLGGLANVSGPRPFEAILSVEDLRVATAPGAEAWPAPRSIAVSQPLLPQHNYLWVQAQGDVTFIGRDEEGGYLELSYGKTQARVRVLRGEPEWLRRFHHSTVRVEGVCEGVYDPQGMLVPGLIWVTRDEGILQIEAAKTNLAGHSSKLMLSTSNQTMIGFYGTRGVVTFNDTVFGQDYMFIQEDTAAMCVSLKDRKFGNQFEVGRWVELGGSLRAGKNIPVLSPLVMMEVGWRSMPTPVMQPLQFPVPGSRDGRWTEAEGVVHAVNSNRTLTLVRNGEPLSVWMGKTAPEALDRYVDSRLRLRGVLSLTIQDMPLLLVPSTSFVEVEREALRDPFALASRSISDAFDGDAEEAMPHRVKVTGNLTFIGKPWFFMQDASGGVRVQPVAEPQMKLGQTVEVVGFTSANGPVRALTEALVRPAGGLTVVQAQPLDAGEGVSFHRAGALVQITANLIGQRTEGGRQVLDLQEKQRLFEADLPLDEPAKLPAFVPGSRLQLVGVCDFAAEPPALRNGAAESPSTGALKIRLRGPADVVLLSGPPWGMWKHTVTLVGTLLTVLMVSLLRLHLLRRRLERQSAFSRQILESQEGERRRIAANLHDSLGQNLLVIKNQARLAMQPGADESMLQQRLDQISGCASQAIDEVREITHALRPYQLDRLGLTRTIRATVERAAENSAILFASHADDIDGLFDQEAEIHVYRIVQEALSNILKHSSATEAAVVVKRIGSIVSLSIRDNGHGFDAGMIHPTGAHDVGHGIHGIHERVRILGGTLLVDSRPEQGTNLSIQIPISVPKVPVPVPKHEAA